MLETFCGTAGLSQAVQDYFGLSILALDHECKAPIHTIRMDLTSSEQQKVFLECVCFSNGTPPPSVAPPAQRLSGSRSLAWDGRRARATYKSISGQVPDRQPEVASVRTPPSDKRNAWTTGDGQRGERTESTSDRHMTE